MIQVPNQRCLPFMSPDESWRLARFNPPAFRLPGRGVF